MLTGDLSIDLTLFTSKRVSSVDLFIRGHAQYTMMNDLCDLVSI